MIVGAALAVGVAWNGAASLEARTVLHAILLGGCVVAALLPREYLAESGTAQRLAVPAVIVGLVGIVTLIPLPHSVLAWVSPGTAAAYPVSAHPIALSITGGITGLGVPILAAGAVVLTAMALRPDRRRGIRIERPAAIAMLVIACLALVQHTVGGERLYGLWPVRTELGASWAPLINGNFDAFLIGGLMPVVVGGLARDAHIERPWTWVCGVAAACGVVVIVWVGSVGAFVGLGVAALVALGRWWTPQRRWLGLSLAAAAMAVGVGVGLALPTWAPGWTESSLSMRVDQWWATGALVGDHPWLGVGPGGYDTAFPPYQPPFRFVRYDHVHNDILEAVAEVGLVGVVLVAASLLVVPLPGARSLVHRGTWIELGIVAWLVHSCVDFPLHLPGLLLVVAAAFAVRVVAWSRPRTARVVVVRGALIGLAGLQAVGALWSGHAALVERTADRLRVDPTDEATITRLEAVAPWRLEATLARARIAARAGDEATATQLARGVADTAPYDADLLYQAGAVLVHVRALDDAERVLERAITRHAADHRARALLSRVEQARGDRDRALALWSDAVQRWPTMLAENDRPFVRALELQPQGLFWVHELDHGAEPSLLVLLAAELMNQGDAAAALLAFRRASELDARLGHHPLEGVALVQIGLVEDGLAFMAEADAYDEDGRARRLRARTLSELGRMAEAREDAKHALDESPGNIESQIIRLRAEASVEGPATALQVADRMLASPERADPRVATAVGQIAKDGGMWSECVRWLSPHAEVLTPGARSTLAACRDARLGGGGS